MNRYAKVSARIMRGLLVSFRSSGSSREPASRGHVVEAIEQALALRARRRARRTQLIRGGKFAAVASAAAAVVLVAGWAVSHRDSGAFSARSSAGSFARSSARSSDSQGLGDGARAGRTLTVLGGAADLAGGPSAAGAVVSGGGTNRRPLAGGMTVESGTGLVAPAASEVRIGTAEGTILTLEKGGELTVVEQSAVQRFSLRHGAVRAQVAKVLPAERFVITTNDAEVEAHGTVFRVAAVPSDPACGNGVRTRVSVFEGVVGVRAGGTETLVGAGAEWPEACPKATPKATRITADPVIERPAAFGKVNQSRRASRPVASTPRPVESGALPAIGAPSTLTVQNDLFAAAIRAKAQKRISDSVLLFSQLVDNYPDGPLTEGAMAQRMRLLATVDPAAASRGAFEYLKRFPSGLARVEARRLAGLAP